MADTEQQTEMFDPIELPGDAIESASKEETHPLADTLATAGLEELPVDEEPTEEEAPKEEAEAEPEPKQQPAGDVSPLTVDPVLLHQARSLGVNDNEIAILARDPIRFRNWVSALQAGIEAMQSGEKREIRPDANRAEDLDFKIQFDNDEDKEAYDSPLVAAMNKQLSKLGAQLKRLETLEKSVQAQGRFISRAEQTELEQQIGTFDKLIVERGHADILGKGSSRSLQQGSPEWGKRDQILKKIGVLQVGHQASGLPMPGFDELYDMAVSYVCRDELDKRAKKQLGAELGKRADQAMKRPTKPGAEPVLSADERALRKLEEKMGRPR